MSFSAMSRPLGTMTCLPRRSSLERRRVVLSHELAKQLNQRINHFLPYTFYLKPSFMHIFPQIFVPNSTIIEFNIN